MNIYTPLTQFQSMIQFCEMFSWPACWHHVILGLAWHHGILGLAMHHGILGLAMHNGTLGLALHHGILGLGVRCLLSGTSMATSRLLKFDSSDSSELYTTAILCFVNG